MDGRQKISLLHCMTKVEPTTTWANACLDTIVLAFYCLSRRPVTASYRRRTVGRWCLSGSFLWGGMRMFIVYVPSTMSLSIIGALAVLPSSVAAPTSSTKAASSTLIWLLLSILLTGILAQIILLGLVIKYRKSPSIKAGQPVGLSLIAAAGAVALVGGCCLIVSPSLSSHYARVCATIAEPLIFSSITTIGASLAGMAWRVERIASPITRLGRRNVFSQDRGSMLFNGMKEEIMRIFAVLAFLSLWNMGNASNRTNLRQSVLSQNLVQLTALLTLPQIILQISIVSVTTGLMKESPTERPPGTWWTVLVGTLLTILPFLSSLIITFSRKGHATIPSVLSLEYATRTTFTTFLWAVGGVGPILILDSSNPNLSNYIPTFLLLAAVVPPAMSIWKKLHPILIPNQEETLDIMDQVRASMRSVGNDRVERSTEALEQGKIFEEVGMSSKSLKIYTDALDLWQKNNNEIRQFVGDFSINEIKSFRALDCELIAKLLLAKASLSENHNVLKAAKGYLKAIELYEFAPSLESVKDRSTIFPCFHALFRLLRDGKLERSIHFEKALAVRFVQESKGSDSYHHACALAIYAEMKANCGLTEEALEEVNAMSKIYCAANHSRAIHEVSGLDVCALVHSKSALWYMKLGDESSALKQCEFVMSILQDLQSTDVREMHAIITPIINIMLGEKGQVDRVRSVYDEYVMHHIEKPAMPFFVRIMQIILRLSSDETFEYDWIASEMNWILSNELREVPPEPDFFYISLGMSMNSLAAEACLFLAPRLDNGKRRIIDKGLAMATVASEHVNHNVIMNCTMAHTKNERIISDLKHLASEMGYNSVRGWEMQRVIREQSYAVLNQRGRRVTSLMIRAKKTLPHDLLLQYDTVAFVGLTNDSLPKVFLKALSEEPGRCWKSVNICYMAESLLGAFVPFCAEDVEAAAEDLRQRALASKTELRSILDDCVDQLRFYEIKHHCFFGSWFGWREVGGYIHVSPSIWGVDAKRCPSQSYRWEPETQPSAEYNSYRQGIENIIADESFATELDESELDESSATELDVSA